MRLAQLVTSGLLRRKVVTVMPKASAIDAQVSPWIALIVREHAAAGALTTGEAKRERRAAPAARSEWGAEGAILSSRSFTKKDET